MQLTALIDPKLNRTFVVNLDLIRDLIEYFVVGHRVEVRLGENKINHPEPGKSVQDIPIEKLIRHENYDKDITRNDIMLVKLARKAQFTGNSFFSLFRGGGLFDLYLISNSLFKYYLDVQISFNRFAFRLLRLSALGTLSCRFRMLPDGVRPELAD